MVFARLSNIALALLVVLQLSSAQPHGRRHGRRFATPNEVVNVIETVYVDQDGNIIDPTRTVEPVVVKPTPTPSSTPVVESSPSPSPVAEKKRVETTSDTTTVTTSSTKSKGGIVYSPYNNDGTCKDQTTFLADAAKLSDFNFLRLYGTDCSQVVNGIAAAKKYGLKLFLGIHNIADSDNEIKNLITMVGGDWAHVYTVAVGNEAVNSGQMSATDVAARVNSARVLLRAAKYDGPVVTADTFVAIMANKALCDASDYVAANCHPFFDGKVVASASGDFLKTQSQNVKNICGGKKVLITETGWPYQGNPNGAAVPSVANQAAAISSIKNAMGLEVVYFTAFDDGWKKDNPATFNAEKHWGIQNLGF
ncbi:glycoside hydrolase [Choiromyces venosus 120613-1]|uniref:Glycoside hydrolase n=1 Tax=Choiromyces venosus 120613-1 TaxID=1336337 RepID=A0A3N4JLX6_9PEZI|nr:glycoside hydrolase [Choiromyces venosus 120613-1]